MNKLVEDHEDYLKKTFLPTFFEQEHARLKKEIYALDLRYEELDKEYEELLKSMTDITDSMKRNGIEVTNCYD